MESFNRYLDQFQQNTVWQLRDGSNINFWLDKGTPSGTSLISITNQSFIDTTLSVREVVTPSGEWNYDFLNSNLPHDVTLQVLALPAPLDTDGQDSIGWGGTSTRDFTIQSAYFSQCSRDQSFEGDWKALWNWKGPHRIQTFMWMAAHERLLTNYRRSKWGVGISLMCSGCDRDNETTLHVLRDCPKATQIWIRLVPSNYITNFFSFDCMDWIFKNINNQLHRIQNKKWTTIFLVACWYI